VAGTLPLGIDDIRYISADGKTFDNRTIVRLNLERNKSLKTMNFPPLASQDAAATFVGVASSNRGVDLEQPQLKEEILLLIASYLMENGFSASSHTLLDEAALKVRTLSKDRSTFRSMSKAVVAGNWVEVETLLKQVSSVNQGPKMKGLRYSVYRQQFLEMVDKGESQKAFTYLLGNLKPMPNISSEDLHALTAMLTCRNVAESDPSWPGVAASREALANQVLSLGVTDVAATDAPPDITQIVPPRRLNVLLSQAVMYQRSRSEAGLSVNLPCRSLLRDYEVTGSRTGCIVTISSFTPCKLGTPTQRIGCLRGDSVHPIKFVLLHAITRLIVWRLIFCVLFPNVIPRPSCQQMRSIHRF